MNSHLLTAPRVIILQAITLSSLLLLPAFASATAQKGAEDCVTIKESTKRLECYDVLAQHAGAAQTAAEKPAERDVNCKDSVLSRLGGSFFRSFPRQRELW